jgi:WhiB family redox-sensing transcriptional regulator
MTDIFTSRFLKFAKLLFQHDPECGQVPDIFYPEETTQPSASTKLAKEICERCPIINECGQYALEEKEPFGIWGGMTTHERRMLRKNSRM